MKLLLAILLISGSLEARTIAPDVLKCIQDQSDLFGDICAEGDVETPDDGARCAVETALLCIEGLR